MNFPEHFDGLMDEFFTYPVMSPKQQPYDNDVASEFQRWEGQVRLGSYSGSTTTAPSLTISRSPSLPSDAVDSPVVDSPLPIGNDHGGLVFRLTWPGDGHHQAPSEHSKQSTASALHGRSLSVTSTTSTEDVMPADPHHEGSCVKCRMTEAEARKCRLERRREQNRASQRKFRARKEAKIREAASQVAALETYVEFLEKHNGDLETTNADLRRKITDMEKTERTRSLSPTDLASRDDSVNIPRLSDTHFPAARSTSTTTNTITTAQRQAMDLYLPLFDHELQPYHRFSNKRRRLDSAFLNHD